MDNINGDTSYFGSISLFFFLILLEMTECNASLHVVIFPENRALTEQCRVRSSFWLLHLMLEFITAYI